VALEVVALEVVALVGATGGARGRRAMDRRGWSLALVSGIVSGV
jgi:hypothetical protein